MQKILLGFSLFLAGCLTMQNAPITHLYVVDTTNNVCSERKIIDKNTLSSVWVQDLPLEKCNGNWSLTTKEFLDLRTYLKSGN